MARGLLGFGRFGLGGYMSLAAMILSAANATPAHASVGRTVGSLSVGNDGSASYVIPVFSPLGVQGLQPSIALTYNSRSGPGYLGKGWQLSGLSALSRCRKTASQDEHAEAVRLFPQDGYCLDGNRLRLQSGTYGWSGSTYATELADFSRITASGTTGNGPTYWTVERKDGLIYTYGGTSDSRVLGTPSVGSDTVSSWRLSQIADRSGNNVLFVYESPDSTTIGTTHPLAIHWTRTSTSSSNHLYSMEFAYGVDENALPSSPTGFVADNTVRDTDLLTSISVKQSGTTVRKYVLGYESSPTTGAVRLNSVTECSDAIEAVCLASTTITYQNGEVGVEPGPSFSGNMVAANTNFDFDGNGFRDLAYRRDGAWYVRFASQSGYGSEVSTGVEGWDLIAGDPFGNGRDVIMATHGPFVGYGTGWYWHAFIWDGASFTPISTGVGSAVVASGLSLNDVDGDGRDDMVYVLPDYPNGVFWLGVRPSTSLGSTLSFDSDLSFPWGYLLPPPIEPLGGGYHFVAGVSLPSTPSQWFLGDLDSNGDGIEDVIVNGIIFQCDVNNSCNEYDFSTVLLPTKEQAYDYYFNFELALTSYSYRLHPVHLNGDGCTDFLTFYGGNNVLRSGCMGDFSSTTPAGLIRGAVDWDGDGRQDVLVEISGHSTLDIQLSTGEGLSAPVSTGLPLGCTVFTTDANGDGLQDVGCLYYGSGIEIFLHKGALEHPDLAVKFKDGYGLEHEVAYVISTHEGYTPSSTASYPQQDVNTPRILVREVKSPSGTSGSYTTTYSYSGATRDVEGRGFQGFEAIESVDSRNNIKHVRRFRRDFPYSGMVVEEEFRQGDGKLISSRVVAPSVDVLDSTLHNERYFVYPASSVENTYEVGGGSNGAWITSTVLTSTFDAYGNLTTSTRSVIDKDAASIAYGLYDSEWTVATSNTFSPNTMNWCLGLPVASTVTYSTSMSEPTVVRSKSFEADYVNCRLSKEVVEPGSNLRRTETAYGYDAFGNLSTIAVTGRDASGNPMTTRVHEVDWGSANGTIGGTGQFPVLETNALGQSTSRTYHATFGSLATETDPNGIVLVNNTYDAFGRRSRETRADGTSKVYTYAACETHSCESSLDRMVVFVSERDAADSEIRDTRIHLDLFDRPWISDSRNIAGGYDRVWRRYDAHGRVEREGIPCPASTCAALWPSNSNVISNSYDLLGRVILQSRPQSESLPNLVSTSVHYEGRRRTIVDPEGKVTLQVQDVNGWLRRTQDHDGYYQLFSYDGAGSLIEVTDSVSSLLFAAQYSYGAQALQTSTTDMAFGAWSFTYNSLGELVGWSDAKNQSFSQTFDLLSRVTSRTEAEGTTTFTFGTSAASRNIGRLASVSMSDYSESFIYDSAGRLGSRIITIDQSDEYEIDYSYNQQGQLDVLAYPESTFASRVKVKHGYAYGILNSLTDWTSESEGTVYWEANIQNARGQTTQETLGNDVVTVRSFDAVTGWLNSIQSGLSGGGGLQNLGYQYDLSGNVIQRQENTLGLTENFFYDDLYRLTSSTLNGTPNLTLTYNAMGNIMSRSDVNAEATWTYDGSNKHAVTSTGSGGDTFSYDANGNMISRGGSTINWTSYNYPAGVSTGTEGTTLYYGPDRQYYKQVYSGPGGNETTHYVGDILEKVFDGTTLDWRHYIRVGGQVVAIVSPKASGPSTVHYALGDNQGSGATLVNAVGSGYVRQSFGAFGLSRDGNDWQGAVPSGDQDAINAITRRGYTGHSMLGAMGLIHMNGRVQDAVLGRFLSPDPYIPNPGFTQSYNRYSYVNNNPMSFVDPSGFTPDHPRCPPGSSPETCELDVTQDRGGGFSPSCFPWEIPVLYLNDVAVCEKKPDLHTLYPMDYWADDSLMGSGGGAARSTDSQVAPWRPPLRLPTQLRQSTLVSLPQEDELGEVLVSATAVASRRDPRVVVAAAGAAALAYTAAKISLSMQLRIGNSEDIPERELVGADSMLAEQDSLSAEEEAALRAKEAGKPYDPAAYNRARQKQIKNEKYAKERNKRKRGG